MRRIHQYPAKKGNINVMYHRKETIPLPYYVCLRYAFVEVFVIHNASLGYKTARTEEYVDFVGDFMYPKNEFKPYGYDAENGRVGFAIFISSSYFYIILNLLSL